MFILTIDSNDLQKIRETLERLISKPLARESTGEIGGVRFEYDVMRKQPWTFMAGFLHYNSDGYTLKSPVYTDRQVQAMDPHGIEGMTPSQLLSALESGQFNEKLEPTERDYAHACGDTPI